MSGGPYRIVVLDGTGGGRGREAFMEIGTATLHPDGACAGAGEPVRVMAWTVAQ